MFSGVDDNELDRNNSAVSESTCVSEGNGFETDLEDEGDKPMLQTSVFSSLPGYWTKFLRAGWLFLLAISWWASVRFDPWYI